MTSCSAGCVRPVTWTSATRTAGSPSSPSCATSRTRPSRPPYCAAWPTFLEEPSSFFYEGERPLGAEAFGDPFRRGLLRIARATSEAELGWLAETLAGLED